MTRRMLRMSALYAIDPATTRFRATSAIPPGIEAGADCTEAVRTWPDHALRTHLRRGTIVVDETPLEEAAPVEGDEGEIPDAWDADEETQASTAPAGRNTTKKAKARKG